MARRLRCSASSLCFGRGDESEFSHRTSCATLVCDFAIGVEIEESDAHLLRHRYVEHVRNDGLGRPAARLRSLREGTQRKGADEISMARTRGGKKARTRILQCRLPLAQTRG